MNTVLNIVQIFLALILILVILIQVRGAGGGIFGGGGATFRTRRGIEKILFQFTIVLAIVFVIVSILSARLG